MRKLFLLVVLLTIFGCSSQPYVKINGEKINVEVADEAQEMMKGLMFREELCDNCGMIFVFDADREHSFWMKNTLIPLDMIFINSDFIIVDVLSAEPCIEDPCPHYTPKEKAQFVVEVNKGRFDDSITGKKVKIFL